MSIKYSFMRIICCMLILAVFCACESTPSNPSQSVSSNIQSDTYEAHSVYLPFSKRDSLNPFKSETKQNLELTKLLFDPLIKLNESFEPELYIAQSYDYKDKKCTVKIKSIHFTDGSNLTADDIIYSFKAAQSSAYYKNQLSGITAAVSDVATIVFTMSYADPNMINLLDFPIIKSGTSDLKDENNRSIPPIGCGRYYFDDKESLKLKANNSYYNCQINTQEINLVDCPDDDSLSHYTVSGTISSVYSDMSNNNVPKKSGEYIKSPTTNLVFIGVNCAKGKLSDERIRLAISSAIDRALISAEGYYGYAQAANNVFSPNWSLSKSIDSINVSQNIAQTVAYFDSIGYNEKDSDGFIVDDKGNRVSFSLMYNTDNTARANTAKLISGQLKKCGIEIILKGVSYSAYKQNLSSGSFELYIGEVKLSKSFYIKDILSGNVIAGYPANPVLTPESNNTQDSTLSQSSAADMFAKYYSGDVEIETALSAFAAEMPFIPICYRCGVTVSSNWLAPHLKVSISDVYNGIEGYK